MHTIDAGYLMKKKLIVHSYYWLIMNKSVNLNTVSSHIYAQVRLNYGRLSPKVMRHVINQPLNTLTLYQ